jgi:hypothetical protein
MRKHIAMGLGLVLLSLAAGCRPAPGSAHFVGHGRGVTAEEANRDLWTNFVPSSAKDVWFYSNQTQTRIECELDLADFQDWCNQNGWRPEAIVAGQPRTTWSERSRKQVLVQSGIAFGAVKTSGSHGFYDDKTGRAYVFYYLNP